MKCWSQASSFPKSGYAFHGTKIKVTLGKFGVLVLFIHLLALMALPLWPLNHHLDHFLPPLQELSRILIENLFALLLVNLLISFMHLSQHLKNPKVSSEATELRELAFVFGAVTQNQTFGASF